MSAAAEPATSAVLAAPGSRPTSPCASTAPARTRSTAAYLVVPLVLLGVGGDSGWWQAWAFSLLVLVAGVGGRVWAERRHPGLQADRMRFGRGQQVEPWDRVLAPAMAFSVLYLLVIVGGLDHRYGWTTPSPTWVNVVGLLLCASGYGFGAWVLVENRYAGSLLGVVGIPLALDALWAFVAAGFALIVSVVRTALEDRTLMEELPGYREYARRVRYRLFPGLW